MNAGRRHGAKAGRLPDPARVRKNLLRWFSRHRRDFFWRGDFADGAPLSDFQFLLVEFLLWKTNARSASLIERIVRRHPSPDAVLVRTRAELEEELRPLGLFRRRAACMLVFAAGLLTG